MAGPGRSLEDPAVEQFNHDRTMLANEMMFANERADQRDSIVRTLGQVFHMSPDGTIQGHKVGESELWSIGLVVYYVSENVEGPPFWRAEMTFHEGVFSVGQLSTVPAPLEGLVERAADLARRAAAMGVEWRNASGWTEEPGPHVFMENDGEGLPAGWGAVVDAVSDKLGWLPVYRAP